MLERHQHYLEQEIKTKELLHLKEKEQQNLLLESIVGAQEKEQRRIAQDLHDEIGPVLAFIKIKAGYLQQCLQENPELEAVSKEVADQLAGAIVQIRRITHDLLPQIVEDLGIVEALKELAANVSTAAGVEFTFDEGKVQEFPLEIRQEVTLYRIVQELVHNSLKHGKPSRIYLTLAITKEELTLIYQDNGLGFSTE